MSHDITGVAATRAVVGTRHASWDASVLGHLQSRWDTSVSRRDLGIVGRDVPRQHRCRCDTNVSQRHFAFRGTASPATGRESQGESGCLGDTAGCRGTGPEMLKQ